VMSLDSTLALQDGMTVLCLLPLTLVPLLEACLEMIRSVLLDCALFISICSVPTSRW